MIITTGSVNRNSCWRGAPRSGPVTGLKKFRIKVLAALASEFGRNGNNTKGVDRPKINYR